MRIISKFRDYYDSIQAHGQDLTTVYVRTPEYIKDNELLKALASPREHTWMKAEERSSKLLRPYHPDEKYFHDDKRISRMYFRTFHVLFCGKVFRGISVETTLRECIGTPSGGLTGTLTDHFYSYEDFEAFLFSYGKLVKDIYREKFLADKREYVQKLAAFLSRQGTDELEQLLVNKRITTATQQYQTRYEHLWESDASLKDVKFFKIRDPYTAFQELDMYISGVLGQQAKEVVNISDKDRIYQHGFDRYSFRKLPEERGRKKQNGN